jgi:exodeoxyribonuclease V alpha subunit
MMEHVARMLAGLLTAQAHGHADGIKTAVNAVTAGLEEGHICVDVAQDERLAAVLPMLRTLRGIVGAPGDVAPLVLDEGRLYLGRYWNYEQKVAASLTRIAAPPARMPEAAELRIHLGALFPGEESASEQAFAALGAAVRDLAVISGGPGTGKTTTVSRILALKLLLRSGSGPYTIRLAAPTGKAADRLREAIASAKRQMRAPAEILDQIPEEASTIHRLLGIRDASGRPQRNEDNPIPADLLVLDEASMIDLSLLAKVLSALKPGAGLILLGDKDQLDAVQPGSVFGEICAEPAYSRSFLGLAEEVLGTPMAFPPGTSPLPDVLFRLTRSYRFRDNAGIGSLARAVNAGDEDRAITVLKGDAGGELVWRPAAADTSSGFPVDIVARWLRPYFERLLRDGSEDECLRLFGVSRLLTPHREGPGSVVDLNDRVEHWLRTEGLVPHARDWYPGKPVVITANNTTLGLYNGDVGITMADARGELRVVFHGAGGTFRSFAPARLPAYDRAYATTVHKSQGSEFDEVLLLLPGMESQVVTRNLLYTAVTRARRRCIIQGTEEIVRAGTRRKPRKMSGLARVLERMAKPHR